MLQHYTTGSGLQIEYEQLALAYEDAIEPLIKRLDHNLGGVFASSFEFPGRYTCWDIGFCNPPVSITCRQQNVLIHALNQRGQQILAMLQAQIQALDYVAQCQVEPDSIRLEIGFSDEIFTEELRSQQPSVFSLIRDIIQLFHAPQEPYLGLYGSFGYDLVFQFEPKQFKHQRDEFQRDMVLFLPDEIYVVNHQKEQAFIRRYDFSWQNSSTQGLARTGQNHAYRAEGEPIQTGDHLPGEYAAIVEEAKQKFKRGDLFEVVPSQTFYESYEGMPSELFRRMKRVNPSPYGFFINLGLGEFLVGASPEMYVKVSGKRVETCPISGTIKRGDDAIEDAKNIQFLLDSPKEKSELTMCTDVDRNDKSRICEPGSVKVIGRRQIEMYSRLIHTVDHIEGYLREGFDAVDAFLSHMWVVTVTGAPKIWAMDFIEQHEKSPRKWYAGAVGWFNFNGNLNTGLVLRTVRLHQGVAEIRVGATLLYDSEPEAEEEETRLKASAFLDLIRNKAANESDKLLKFKPVGQGKSVLLIDHQDSFVHTLGNYLRQTGAQVTTIRFEHALSFLNQKNYDLVVLSPGPGSPDDFQLKKTIAAVLDKQIPLFGVCLGLQGIVAYFGGSLSQLDYPMHGKPSLIQAGESLLFEGIESQFVAGRYHSLYASAVPEVLTVTARTDEGCVMAIEHRNLPIYAVQFHPETILSMDNQVGLTIIYNLMNTI